MWPFSGEAGQIDYKTARSERTRHTNADYPERVSEDELKQSAIFMATFAWQAAMLEEKIPRTTAK